MSDPVAVSRSAVIRELDRRWMTEVGVPAAVVPARLLPCAIRPIVAWAGPVGLKSISRLPARAPTQTSKEGTSGCAISMAWDGKLAAPEAKVWMKLGLLPVVTGAPNSMRSQWPILITSIGTTALPCTVIMSWKGAAASRLLPAASTSDWIRGCSALRSIDMNGMRSQLPPGAVP
jgi:hypothetical protein